MKQQQTNKHSNLHREDQHITVEELWKGWKTSEGKESPVSNTHINHLYPALNQQQIPQKTEGESGPAVFTQNTA